MSFLDMETSETLPLCEPAIDPDLTSTQCAAAKEGPSIDAVQARQGKVETAKERQERLDRLREEKQLKKVAVDQRRSIRESCGKETVARHRARQRTTIASYFRRKDPCDRKRKCGNAFDDVECVPETTSGGSESSVNARVPGSAEKNAIHILSSDSSGDEGSSQSATGASTSNAGSPNLHSAPPGGIGVDTDVDVKEDDLSTDDAADSDSDEEEEPAEPATKR
jgi:hypothetical protein